MKDLKYSLKTAEVRYDVGQLVAMFFLGIIAGSFTGWLLWG